MGVRLCGLPPLKGPAFGPAHFLTSFGTGDANLVLYTKSRSAHKMDTNLTIGIVVAALLMYDPKQVPCTYSSESKQ
jgi:hypothetical protein